MSAETQFEYSGDELDVFSIAKNWKRYWSSQIDEYMGDEILEIGAGIGATAEALGHRVCKRWVSLEPDARLCEILVQRWKGGSLPSGMDVRHGTSVGLDSDEKFDTALYIDVLEHIEDDKQELSRIVENVRVGGHIVIVSPAHNYLYTDFDNKIGHYRRYNKQMLLELVPHDCKVAKLRYLDSAGMLASLANKLILTSDTPTVGQIKFWDRVMVRVSRLADPLLGYSFGKSILIVLRKERFQPDNGAI